ncbi:MAG: ComF family protein [Azoarcus sp.]|jgi:ComF family protein|nr:ComF family protein [Azoarcus sp.]
MNLVRATWKSLLSRALDALAARDCRLCGCPVEGGDMPLCAACARDLPRRTAPCCPNCALPVPGGEICGRCLRHPPAFDATFAAFDYVFPLDVLMQALKYRHHLPLARFFAREMARAPLPPVDLIVPMPLHPRRLRARGFNQAVELARPLARALAAPLALGAASRVRDTVSQTSLDRAARLTNLRGAFACRRLDGQRIAVIDDVMTTGASLEALARCLKTAGATAVYNLVAARASGIGFS